MEKSPKIMAAIDFSSYSKLVLGYSIQLAKIINSQVLICNVINKREVEFIQAFWPHSFSFSDYLPHGKTETAKDADTDRRYLPWDEVQVPKEVKDPESLAKHYIDHQKQERQRKLEDMLKEIDPEHVHYTSVFYVGIPQEELIRAVQNEGVDLLVMGPKGKGNVPQISFGSVAEKMFRHCPVPLLSIRGESDFLQHLRSKYTC